MILFGAGDLLISYDGQTIVYDTIGNSTRIGFASLSWQGRRLMQYVNGSNTYAYTYNADGIRTSKTINGVTHEYVLNGTQIVMETVSDTTGELYTLVYLYDEAGAPIGMKYRTPTYSPNVFDCFFFEKNLQGDIVAVYDSDGTEIATYVYTAWGECTMSYYSATSNSPGLKNPFKYRGYYHDSETNWYYLQSRYYNSNWGRFINADSYVSTGTGLLGYNMFAYCNNNPVMYIDNAGGFPWLIAAVVLAASLVLLTSCNITSYTKVTESESFETYEAALEKAYDKVYTKAQESVGSTDKNGNAAEFGVEYEVDIYYNSENKLFYLTPAYSDYDDRSVTHKYLTNSDENKKFDLMGCVHYHPINTDISLVFNEYDQDFAEHFGVAVHIVDADNRRKSYYDYMLPSRKDLIFP